VVLEFYDEPRVLVVEKKIRMILVPHKNGNPSQVLGLDIEKN
jgi:hypothetical protein